MKDPNNTRDTVPRRGSPLWWYLGGVTVIGALVFGAAMLRGGVDEFGLVTDDSLFWILAGLILFGELKPIVTPGVRDSNGAATSTTLTFATLLYLGFPVAVVLHVAATFVTGFLRRRAPHRTAFNAAQYAISYGAAALVLQIAGLSASPAHPRVPEGGDVFVIALAGTAYFIANHLLVAMAVALHERVSLRKVCCEDLGYQVLVHLALLGLAPLVALSMHHSAAFVPLFVLPFIAVYLNAAIALRREHQALHDSLTGLPNRKVLILRTEEALAEARRVGMAGRPDGTMARRAPRVGLFLLDLDRFKEVNDTLGHPTGDRLLQLVAHRLTHSVRPGDLVTRLGGDEFAVLLPSVRDARAAREVAHRLRVALSEPVRLDGMSFDLEGSIGIALHPDHAPDFELLLQRADVAMYVAKENRTGVEVYDAAKDRNSPDRLCLLGELRRALDRAELDMRYQPKVSLVDGHVIGMEALLRWRHPQRGLLTAAEFLPTAEQTYLMRSITSHVVEAVLVQTAEWWSAGLQVPVSINASARDLLDNALTETIAAGLTHYSVPPHALELEITERILMNEPAYAADTVERLAALGISLSLDDFGTGYSSLVRLKRLPVKEIKIDASFVGRIRESGDDAVIVRSIVNLVRALGLQSVAEGVEDTETAQRLRDMGCDAAQGWFFGEPMCASCATSWLKRRLDAPQPSGAPLRAEPVGNCEEEPSIGRRPGPEAPWSRPIRF